MLDNEIWKCSTTYFKSSFAITFVVLSIWSKEKKWTPNVESGHSSILFEYMFLFLKGVKWGRKLQEVSILHFLHVFTSEYVEAIGKWQECLSLTCTTSLVQRNDSNSVVHFRLVNQSLGSTFLPTSQMSLKSTTRGRNAQLQNY